MQIDLQLVFPPKITLKTLKLDNVMWSTAVKKVCIIKLTIPWEEGIPAAQEFKRLNYSEAGWTATFHSVEVGCRGFMGSQPPNFSVRLA